MGIATVDSTQKCVGWRGGLPNGNENALVSLLMVYDSRVEGGCFCLSSWRLQTGDWTRAGVFGRAVLSGGPRSAPLEVTLDSGECRITEPLCFEPLVCDCLHVGLSQSTVPVI